MSESTASVLSPASEELLSLFEGSVDGILVVEAGSGRLVRANRAVCDLLGYSETELLSLSMTDLYPAESVPQASEAFDAMCQGRRQCARNVPCKRKDGSLAYADVAVRRLSNRDHPLRIAFFHDTTEQNRTIQLLCASEERYRLIADHVADVIWTAPLTLSEAERVRAKVDVPAVAGTVLDRWRFSFVSPAVVRVFGYTPDEAVGMSLRDLATPASYARIRETLIENFIKPSTPTEDDHEQDVLELEFLAKDGSSRWCEVVSTYLRDDEGLPTSMLGITRDVPARRLVEQALCDSESRLRSLFDHLPDGVATIDRDGNIYFINRNLLGKEQESLAGKWGFEMVHPEHRAACRAALDRVFATGQPQSVEMQDVFGGWWLCRLAVSPEGGGQRAMVIATDITHERLATEAVDKERRLLRQLLELHERERRLMAYEVHDGFAQQLTGALFRLQGVRETLARNPAQAWESFDAAMRLITCAIDETRRLISNLRPPILDESGIIQAIEYLICEHARHDGPEIEFVHHVAFDRLTPPLESAVFRIVQESLQNACRHSRSDRIRVELVQHGNRIQIDIRDWGVGFQIDAVEEQRFGLQGIRERVRLLDGRVVIESAPGKGTHIGVELPLIDSAGRQTDMIASASTNDASEDDDEELQAP